MPLVTLVLSLVCLVFIFVGVPKSWLDFIIQIWARSLCWIFRVKISVKNRENWPQDRSAVLLFNHSSYFDIFAICAVFPETRFAAKEELFKIPVFGLVMRKLGTISIARKDPQRAIEAMNSVLPRMGGRMIIAFAPEGTRSQGKEILPFKAGPFIFAIQAQVDILPIFIRGASQVWPAGLWMPNVRKDPWLISLELGAPLSTKGLVEKDRFEISRAVRSYFQASLLS
jgi:1-acyl-sn-glycerol-3-phosphate acyltransferase